MAKIPVSKIEKITTQTSRSAQIMKGARNGLIKGTVDKVVDQLSGPITQKLQPMLNNLHPGLQMAEPAVAALIRFALLNALAEVLEFGGPALSKLPGVGLDKDEASAKTRALAQWTRNYAGESLGVEVTEAAATLIPMFVDLFKTMDLSEIMGAVSAQTEEVEQQEQLEAAQG